MLKPHSHLYPDSSWMMHWFTLVYTDCWSRKLVAIGRSSSDRRKWNVHLSARLLSAGIILAATWTPAPGGEDSRCYMFSKYWRVHSCVCGEGERVSAAKLWWLRVRFQLSAFLCRGSIPKYTFYKVRTFSRSSTLQRSVCRSRDGYKVEVIIGIRSGLESWLGLEVS